MISFADNAEALHIEAGLGQLFDSSFRSIVIREHSDDGVHFFHLIVLSDCLRAFRTAHAGQAAK
jgi:hypothetical protein